MNGDGVHGAVHVGQQTGDRNHRGMHASLDHLVGPLAPVRFGDPEQLDAIPEFRCRLEIDGKQAPDALGGDLLEGQLGAEGHRGEKRKFVSGVDSVQVEAGIRFGVAEVLGALHHRFEGLAALLHLAQHEVGRPVQDAMHALDVIGRQALPQRAQDGNAAAHARLEGDVHAVPGGGVEDLGAVEREQGLVGRHDVLALFDRLEGETPRRVIPTNELDDDVDRGIVDQPGGVGIEANPAQIDTPIALGVDVGNANQAQRETQALGDHFRVS